MTRRMRPRWKPWWWVLTAPDTRWYQHIRNHSRMGGYRWWCTHCHRRARAVRAESDAWLRDVTRGRS